MKRWIILIGLLSFACGEEQGTLSRSVSPSAAFDNLPEYSQFDASRCEAKNEYGCGQVAASGSLARGSFNFDELFVSCGKQDQGLFVELVNNIEQNPTFHMKILIWNVSEPPRINVCRGIVTSSTGGQAVQAGSCESIVRIHSESVSSSSKRPCMVQFQNRDQWEGTIQCPFLEDGGKYIIIEGKSRFKCPAS